MFYTQNRVVTSSVFAQNLGLQDAVMPSSLLLFYAGSMGHLNDELAVLDLGYNNAVCEQPVYAGDTLRKTFVIKGLQPTRDGKRTVVRVGCQLFNVSTGERVFSVDKQIIYPDAINPANHVRDAATAPPPAEGEMLRHVVSNAAQLADGGMAHALAELKPGSLLLHGSSRPLQPAVLMSLASLGRLTHPYVFNTQRYGETELGVPGGLVLAQTFAAASRSLFEVVHETVLSARHLAPVHPGDVIGAMSFVDAVERVADSVERATIVTLGVKNTDVVHELDAVPLPLALFATTPMRPREFESLCEAEAPQLSGKLVSHSVRHVYRQHSAQEQMFLL